MGFRVSKYIQQPAWRVWLLHYVAKALGVLAHVEGMPIGSNRLPAWEPSYGIGAQQAIGQFNNAAALDPASQIIGPKS